MCRRIDRSIDVSLCLYIGRNWEGAEYKARRIRRRDYSQELWTSFVTRNTVRSRDSRRRSRATMDNRLHEPIRCFQRYICSRSNLLEISSNIVFAIRSSKPWTCLSDDKLTFMTLHHCRLHRVICDDSN